MSERSGEEWRAGKRRGEEKACYSPELEAQRRSQEMHFLLTAGAGVPSRRSPNASSARMCDWWEWPVSGDRAHCCRYSGSRKQEVCGGQCKRRPSDNVRASHQSQGPFWILDAGIHTESGRKRGHGRRRRACSAIRTGTRERTSWRRADSACVTIPLRSRIPWVEPCSIDIAPPLALWRICSLGRDHSSTIAAAWQYCKMTHRGGAN